MRPSPAPNGACEEVNDPTYWEWVTRPQTRAFLRKARATGA